VQGFDYRFLIQVLMQGLMLPVREQSRSGFTSLRAFFSILIPFLGALVHQFLLH